MFEAFCGPCLEGKKNRKCGFEEGAGHDGDVYDYSLHDTNYTIPRASTAFCNTTLSQMRRHINIEDSHACKQSLGLREDGGSHYYIDAETQPFLGWHDQVPTRISRDEEWSALRQRKGAHTALEERRRRHGYDHIRLICQMCAEETSADRAEILWWRFGDVVVIWPGCCVPVLRGRKQFGRKRGWFGFPAAEKAASCRGDLPVMQPPQFIPESAANCRWAGNGEQATKSGDRFRPGGPCDSWILVP